MANAKTALPHSAARRNKTPTRFVETNPTKEPSKWPSGRSFRVADHPTTGQEEEAKHYGVNRG
jgi:hypothetical protein